MVLWEIAVGTAYFLGLKRTYKIALKVQRFLIPSSRPQLRGFLHRRTRMVFDVALTVHRNIQQKDLEVGRNVGQWVLRWLDGMKPSAAIGSEPPRLICQQPKAATFLRDSWQAISTRRIGTRKMMIGRDMVGRMLASPLNMRLLSKYAPTLGMILHPQSAVGISSNFCRLNHACTTQLALNNGTHIVAQRVGQTIPSTRNQRFDGVLR